MKISPPIIWLNSVDSTNRYALENFNSIADGTSIAASTQTAGRGRSGRQWISPVNENIYLSFVIKNPVNPVYHASIVATISALTTIRNSIQDHDLWIKWPNDIYHQGEKIAGILCEGKISNGKITGIVAGVGINVNMPQATLNTIDQPAASMLSISGKNHDVKSLSATLAEVLTENYKLWQDSPATLFEQWKRENRLINREVEIYDQNQTLKGIITAINDDGSIIFSHQNNVSRFYSGDVKILKTSLL